MNIQIFGTSKSFNTKKAERYFKERRIKFQSIDVVKYGMSGGEFDSVLRAVGGVDSLIDWDLKHPDIDLMRYMDDLRAKEDKVFDNPKLMKLPVVRNGRKATVGYCPEVWPNGESATPLCGAELFAARRLFFLYIRHVFRPDLKIRIFRQSLRNRGKEVAGVGGALDLIGAVLVDHVKAVFRVAGKGVYLRCNFVIKARLRVMLALFFRHIFHPERSIRSYCEKIIR